MFELVENYTPSATIKVIGVGGGGGNAVAQMIDASIEGVEFIAANTDAQALRQFKGKTILQIGSSVTKGLGAGANPEVGRQAALEDRDHIMEMLADSGLVTSLELSELNPFLDIQGQTANLVCDLTASLFGKRLLERPSERNAA